MKLDLRPFGINHTLDSNKPFPTIKITQFSKVINFEEDGKEVFLMGGKKYNEISLEGSGTYGAAYLVADEDGNQSIIKVLKDKLVSKEDIDMFVRESILHLLLAKESAGETNGPYVPDFYEIGYDPRSNIGFLRIQAMRNRVDKLLDVLTPEQNDVAIPDLLKQLAHILKFFGETLAFNHRDMKGDNIMYVKKHPDSNEREYKLIDFGMACLTWHGLQIKGGGYFLKKDPCYKKDRDLSQFLYYLLNFHTAQMSPELIDRLSKMLLANVGPAARCSMPAHCPIHGLKNWVSVYDFLNKRSVFVPAGVPNVVSAEMNRFRAGLPFEGAPAAAAASNCPDGKVRNPKTGRCVTRRKPRRSSAAPSAPVAPAAPAAPAAPVAPVAPAAPACPPGKILNPASGRCVNAYGKIGSGLKNSK